MMPPRPQLFFKGSLESQLMPAKKRKTRSSAVSIVAPIKKKKTKKSKPADDLPTLDPSIEQALDEEVIEDEVDQATAEVSDTDRTPSASPKQTSPTPSAPAHFSRVSISC
jgi:septal ring-binding cell division protein DamX